MASSSVLSSSSNLGLSALSSLPDASTANSGDAKGLPPVCHSGTTLESYILPSNLRVDAAQDRNLALSGMEVIKVSKVSSFV
jgi:hypothetical protein